MSLIRHRRRTFLSYKETGMQKWAEIHVHENWQGICGPFCNDDTNERGLRLLEFATFNDLVLANTFGHHKASRRWTWHNPNGQHHNQIDYILVRKRFRSGVNIAGTRSFPGAHIRSDHDLLMMTFRLRLKKNQQAKTHKTQFWPRKAERSQRVGNLPSYSRREVCTFYHHEQRRYRHRFNDITTFNTAMTETASDILRKYRQKEKNFGSLKKFLICATKGENWERKDLSLKDLRNTRKWITISRGAWKRLKKTG